MATYGRLVSAVMVERAIEARIRAWFSAYVGEALVQAGENRHGLASPSDFFKSTSPDDWPPETNLTAVVVASDGTSSVVRNADGYDMTWRVEGGVVATRENTTQTRETAQFYATGIGMAVAHKGIDLDGASVILDGESYTTRGFTAERTLLIGAARWLVTVENARSLFGGPELPPDDPTETPEGEPGPSVESARITRVDKLDAS
jgi:hypothetical protein